MGVYRRDGTVRGGTGNVTMAELARHPWAFRCDVADCWYGVCAETEQQADRERYIHGCPRKGNDMIGKSLLQQAWEQLDAEVDEIYRLSAIVGMLDRTKPDLEGVVDDLMGAKQRAKGMAAIISLFCIPYYPTAAAISTEAGERYRARQSGTYHRTEGMTR